MSSGLDFELCASTDTVQGSGPEEDSGWIYLLDPDRVLGVYPDWLERLSETFFPYHVDANYSDTMKGVGRSLFLPDHYPDELDLQPLWMHLSTETDDQSGFTREVRLYLSTNEQPSPTFQSNDNTFAWVVVTDERDTENQVCHNVSTPIQGRAMCLGIFALESMLEREQTV
jgi:hypothetical protein